MQVNMPELLQLDILHLQLRTTKTAKDYAKVKSEIDFIYEKLRRELED